MNFSFDYRTSPILTTSNALQGQVATSISELLNTMSEDEVRSLAQDRTATIRTFTIGGTHPINQKFQLSGDITVSRTSGTPASGGVEATSGTDYEFFYSAQLVGSSLIKEGDIAILGLRYSDTTNSDKISLNINTRYPVNRDLRINPRLIVDYSHDKQDSDKQVNIRPIFRVDYRRKRRVHFELESGIEWSNERISEQTDETFGYFFTSGYRVDF